MFWNQIAASRGWKGVKKVRIVVITTHPFAHAGNTDAHTKGGRHCSGCHLDFLTHTDVFTTDNI